MDLSKLSLEVKAALDNTIQKQQKIAALLAGVGRTFIKIESCWKKGNFGTTYGHRKTAG